MGNENTVLIQLYETHKTRKLKRVFIKLDGFWQGNDENKFASIFSKNNMVQLCFKITAQQFTPKAFGFSKFSYPTK